LDNRRKRIEKNHIINDSVVWISYVVLFGELGLSEDTEVRRQIAVAEELKSDTKITKKWPLEKKVCTVGYY
jgi:hypothetical protein